MDVVVEERAQNAPPRPMIDLEFEDLSYVIKGRGTKQILNSISGKFLSGEMTAILGPSGSGKTTLLNILAGYVTKGVTGTVKVNERPREMNMFRKLSTYIMQEDVLQPHLTLHESMMIAAKFKLGDKETLEKKQIVEDILKTLGLENCSDTKTECLSGGQKKRLSIAHEMVSNPPVIFLDEPTSGLDWVAVKQCVETLRALTRQQKTVICTIHQPSLAIFEQFQQVYFIADGRCVYNGATSSILPFLSSIQLDCPITDSPMEYIIEMVQMIPETVDIMVAAIENGKINRRDVSNGVNSTVRDDREMWESLGNFSTSFWMQFWILMGRMFTQMKRNKLRIWIQLFHHTMVGVVFGLLFFNVGNNAELAISNSKFCLFSLFFFVYTYLMPPVLLYPLEIELLKREYFNRWYGLKPYFLALTLQSLPLLMTLGMAFTAITYLMTNQPLELIRFLRFTLIGILVAFASEGVGLAIGSMFNITNGALVAPAFTGPVVLMSIYGMGYGEKIEPSMQIIMGMSYMRFAFVAASQAIFANREPFECTEDATYCIYRDPKQLLQDFGMLNSSYGLNVLGLVLYLLFFRLIAYLALRYRLATEFSSSIVNYFSKILGNR